MVPVERWTALPWPSWIDSRGIAAPLSTRAAPSALIARAQVYTRLAILQAYRKTAASLVLLQRLYDDEAKLRASVGEQGEHLGRTYAEIERLNRLIREMESTRAWRAHLWWQRRGAG